MKNILLLLALGLLSCNTTKTTVSKKTVGVNWVQNETLSETIDQAVEEDKLVLIDFYATWCAPCKMMDQNVFSDKELGDYLNANFVNLKINAEKGNGPSLAFLYGVASYPTYIFVDENGRELVRQEGSTTITKMMAMAKGVSSTN